MYQQHERTLDKDNGKTMVWRKQNKISYVDVIYGINEDIGAISRVYDNTVNGDVPIFVQRMMLINVPLPNCQPMVSSFTLNILPARWARSESIWSMASTPHSSIVIMNSKRLECHHKHARPHQGCCIERHTWLSHHHINSLWIHFAIERHQPHWQAEQEANIASDLIK